MFRKAIFNTDFTYNFVSEKQSSYDILSFGGNQVYEYVIYNDKLDIIKKYNKYNKYDSLIEYLSEHNYISYNELDGLVGIENYDDILDQIKAPSHYQSNIYWNSSNKYYIYNELDSYLNISLLNHSYRKYLNKFNNNLEGTIRLHKKMINFFNNSNITKKLDENIHKYILGLLILHQLNYTQNLICNFDF